MKNHKNKIYQTLNELAEKGGTVIFGGTSDKDIPLCELKQAFGLNEKLYNRSFSGLSVTDAVSTYDTFIAPLKPACILLHLGEDDVTTFVADSVVFDGAYRRLIQHIKESVPTCTIEVITHKNQENNPFITALNKHLKYIAESERVEYEDISANRIWNPKETKEVVSFVYSTGFVHPLKRQRSIYDLVKIFFCYN